MQLNCHIKKNEIIFNNKHRNFNIILILSSHYLRSKISNLKVQQYEYCHLITNKNSSKSTFVIVNKTRSFEINSFLLVILIVEGRNDKNMKKISMIIAARSLYNSHRY